MAGKDAIEVEAADHDIGEILATIQDQGRQTLELLRTLLEDLIATLVAQNRDLLTIARRIHADVRAISDRLPAPITTEQDGHGKSAEAPPS